MDKGTYWEATGVTNTCDLGFLKFTLVSIWKKKRPRGSKAKQGEELGDYCKIIQVERDRELL